MATATLHASDSKQQSDPSIYCDPCKFDDAQRNAEGFCIACCEYLCKCCCKEHNKHKVTRDHTVLKDREFPEDKTPFLAIKQLMKCSIHIDEEVAYECVDHSCLICVTCIAEYHRKCGEVKKLGSQNSMDANGFDLERITSLQIKAMNCNLRSEWNTLCLLMEMETPDDESSAFKSKICKQIEKINCDLQMKLGISSESEIYKSSATASDCKHIESELNKLRCMANIMLKHGSKAERAIVYKHVGKKVDGVVSKLECLENATKSSFVVKKPIVFDGTMLENSNGDVLNKDLLDESDIKPSLVALQGKLFASIADNMEHSQTVQQTRNETNKRPYRTREVGLKDFHMVSSPTDISTCDIVAMEFVCNDRLLLADHSNRKLKLFNGQFDLISELCLPASPTDICINSRGIFVCFLSSKSIRSYIICGKSDKIQASTRFNTRYQAVSLDSFDKDRILVLFLRKGSFDDNKPDNIVIEVRNGSTLDARLKDFTDFAEYEHFRDAKRICKISTSEFLLSGDQRISCYTSIHKKDLTDTVSRKWCYKSRESEVLYKAGGMFIDSEENVYVCGEKSDNVHQFYSLDYRKHRVLIENISRPVAVLMDAHKDRLIVACRDDNFVYVFPFAYR